MSDPFVTRPPTLDDVAAIAELRNAMHVAQMGTPFTDEGEIHSELTDPEFDPEADGVLVLAPTGELVGSSSLWAYPPFTLLEAGNYIHPDWHGRGIGTLVLEFSEARAMEVAERAATGERVVLHQGVWKGAQGAESFLEARGYKAVRYFNSMVIEMHEAPPTPTWPAGITVRTITTALDGRALFDADTEIFQDHWGFFPRSFEGWKHEFFGNDKFDPTLHFVATDGEEVAGIAFCRAGEADNPDGGYVAVLGVRRRWRRQGIALALLQHCFGEMYRRGRMRVNLGVDADNPTGAVKLYERAGMHATRPGTVYEKELIPGRKPKEG